MSQQAVGQQGRGRSLDRRRFLGGLAAGGLTTFAGCGGSGNTGTEGPEYVFMASLRPNDVNWAIPPPPLGQLLYPPGETIRPDGEVVPQIVESTEIEPDRVTLRIREGVTWTTGEPVLAKDLGRWLEMLRVLGPDPAAVERGDVQPDDWRFAFTDFEWDGRELVATAPTGLLRKLTSRFDIWSFFNGTVGATPRAYFEGIWSTYREKYTEPWGDSDRLENARGYLRTALYNPTIENSSLRNADNAVSCGPWKIERVTANEISMRPHDGHPTMPAGANWPTLAVRPANIIDKAAVALKSGSGDAFQPTYGASNRFLPPETSKSFPDSIRQWDGKSFDGQGVLLNQKHDILTDRRVRAALLYAVDSVSMAETVHSVGEQPVVTPGLAAVDESALPGSMVSTLGSYERDRERAASLLREAGFTRTNGEWNRPDGSTFELPILKTLPARMDRPAPLLADAFESQLTDFGIRAQLLPLEETAARERVDTGNFTVVLHTWPVLLGNGHPYHRAAWWYASAVGFGTNRRRQLQLFEDELPGLVEEHDGLGWKQPDRPESSGLSVRDAEPLKELTVDAPPVGTPDGALEAYPVVYLAVKALTEWSWAEEKRRDATKKLLWVYNYDLPYLELTRTVPQLYHNTADWEVPPPDDPIWRHDGPGGYPSGIAGALLHGRISALSSDSG